MQLSDRTDERLRKLVVAVAAGVAGVATSFALAGFTQAFVGGPVNAALTRITPGWVITWAITTLGDLGQHLALLGALAITVSGLAVLAYAGLVIGLALDEPTAGGLLAGIGTATGAVVVSAAVVPSLGAGVATGFVVALGCPRDDGTVPVLTPRRQVLAAVGAASVTAVAGLTVGSRQSQPAAPEPIDDPVVSELLTTADARSLDIEGLDPLVSQGHYTVDIANPDPALAATDWTLSVTGAVEEEREFTFADVEGAPTEHRFVTLRCVGDPLNGRKIDTALWTGTPVTALLPDGLPEHCCVMLRAADDYYEEFPLSALEDALLATRMNGRALPRDHGRPVRALVPGHWGEINVKWLTEIEVLAEPADGFWEERGWHGTGPVNTVAKIHAVRARPGDTVQVAGHAYAGIRGIEQVEISTDGGETWSDATLSERLPGARDAAGNPLRETAQDAWRMWTHEYSATEPHEVVARATDGTGTRQPAERQEAYPRGASGWVTHSVDP